MSIPGDGFDQGSHGDEANPSQTGGRAPEQPDWQPPWDPPAAENPPAAYLPPDYPPGYSAEYPADYPAEYPPPGYGQPPGHAGPPYLPGPPQFSGPPGGYGHPEEMPRATNGLAIASFVSSFTGLLCCLIGSILAIILGVVALNQIKHTRQNGYGMAVAGIVIGVGTLLATLIVALFSVVPAH